MANNGAKFVRHYKGVQARDVRREQRVEDELTRSTEMLTRLASPGSSPSQQMSRAESTVALAEHDREAPRSLPRRHYHVPSAR